MGPTLSILHTDADAPTPQDLLEIARTLDQASRTSVDVSVQSTTPIGGGVNLKEGRPFGFNVDQVGLEEEELAVVAQAFGFTPISAINVFAYANAPVDHRILAELGVFFVRRYGGIVDFCGNLGTVRAHSGTVVEIPYRVDGLPAVFHVSDAAFLEEWLNDAAFHMIK